jgi:hypothetical protein
MRSIAWVFVAEVLAVVVCVLLSVNLLLSGLLGTMDANFLLVVYLTVALVFAITALLHARRYTVRVLLKSLAGASKKHEAGQATVAGTQTAPAATKSSSVTTHPTPVGTPR